MKKRIVYIFGGLVLLLCVALAILEFRYGILIPASKIPASTLVKPETRLQLIVNPICLKDFIQKNIVKNASVPPWAVPMVLPYEASFMVNPDPALGNVKMALNLNTQRLAPVINQQLNQVKLGPPFAEWFKEPMQQLSRGALLREGSTPLNREIAGLVKSVWKPTEVKEPMIPQGQHAIEILADFRDGVGWTALLSLLREYPKTKSFDPSGLLAPQKAALLNTIGTIHLQGDLDTSGTLLVHAAIQCTPDTPQEMVNNLGMILEIGMGQLRSMLSRQQMELQGKPTVDKSIIQGDFKITNVEPLLAQLF